MPAAHKKGPGVGQKHTVQCNYNDAKQHKAPGVGEGAHDPCWPSLQHVLWSKKGCE